MADIKITVTGMQQVRSRFSKLSRRVKDLRPVWNDFIEYYQDFIVPKAFQSRGGIMNAKWPKFSAAYLKWKQKNASGKQMLRLSDDLYNAATGGSGWYQKVKKKKFEFGIKSSSKPGKYALRHQEGNSGMPQRAYFYKVNGDMPNRAWTFLLERLERYIGEK